MRYGIGLLLLSWSIGSIAANCIGPANVVRYTYSYIDPGAPGQFVGASMVYNNNFQLNTNCGQSGFTVSSLPLATDISFKGVNGVIVTPGMSPDGTTLTNVTVQSPGGPDRGWDFDYRIAASATPGQSFLQYDIVGGHHVLRFNGGGAGLLEVGGSFFSRVVINGNWSNPDSHSSALYNPAFTLTDDFAYDAIADVTIYRVETTSYNGSNPGISFYLIGAPVPEPATWALLFAGFGAIAWRRRIA